MMLLRIRADKPFTNRKRSGRRKE